MATFFMNVPVPVDQIMDVYRLLGTPQPPRPPFPAYDPFRDEPVAAMVPLERPNYGLAPLPGDYEPTKVFTKHKPRAKPRCKEVKIFGTKKVRCLKHPNHDGRHSWMDAAS